MCAHFYCWILTIEESFNEWHDRQMMNSEFRLYRKGRPNNINILLYKQISIFCTAWQTHLQKYLFIYVCIFSIWAALEFWLVDSVEYGRKLASPIFSELYTIPFISSQRIHAYAHTNTFIQKCSHACITVIVCVWSPYLYALYMKRSWRK